MSSTNVILETNDSSCQEYPKTLSEFSENTNEANVFVPLGDNKFF